MRTRHENNFREIQSIIVNELMPMYTKSGMKERPEIWVARGVYNIIAKINEIIQNVQQEPAGRAALCCGRYSKAAPAGTQDSV